MNSCKCGKPFPPIAFRSRVRRNPAEAPPSAGPTRSDVLSDVPRQYCQNPPDDQRTRPPKHQTRASAALLVSSGATGACALRLRPTLEVSSFRLQAEFNRGGHNLGRCCRVILEDLKSLAERSCRHLYLTEHNSRAHKAS